MLKRFEDCKFDIIIQGGQSNAQGAGLGDVEEPFWYGAHIWFMSDNRDDDPTISRATETIYGNELQGNFAIPFCQKYIAEGKLEEGRDLLVIRAARGGTGFAAHQWGLEDFYFRQMIDMTQTAVELNPENRIVGFLWHQGEADAEAGVSYDTHYKNLSAMLKYTRKEFGEMPFVAGDFVEKWRKEMSEKADPVRRAIMDVCKNEPNCTFVNTDGLLSNTEKLGVPDNTIHFCREALYELGGRYFDAFKTLVERNS